MRNHIQLGFPQAKKQREVDKLTAILQALKNCHRSMSTLGGAEEAFQAREDLVSAFQRINRLRQEKIQQLELPTESYDKLEKDTGLALVD
jgi:hypothetical protein